MTLLYGGNSCRYRDVHHGQLLTEVIAICNALKSSSGNGTQKAFWNDPDVLYISLHMFKNGLFYPGGIGGASDQVGEGAGTGLSVPPNCSWLIKG